jgi:hypothetical protein
MRTNKSGTARHEDFHASFNLFKSYYLAIGRSWF